MRIQYFHQFHEFNDGSELDGFIRSNQSKKEPYGAYWVIENDTPTFYLFLNGQWATLGHPESGRISHCSEPCDFVNVDFMLENGQVDPIAIEMTVWDDEGIKAFVQYAQSGTFDDKIQWRPQ